MGLEFGNLVRIVGITYYTISPHEQKVLKGIFNPGFKNTVRRCAESFWLVSIPSLLVYTVVQTANDYHEKLLRKNPADYENDV